jgi:hypothetical protein
VCRIEHEHEHEHEYERKRGPDDGRLNAA